MLSRSNIAPDLNRVLLTELIVVKRPEDVTFIMGYFELLQERQVLLSQGSVRVMSYLVTDVIHDSG
jgi:hypothetical protein